MSKLDDVLKLIAEESGKGRLVVFCGAGVSKPAPTNMPTADTIVCNILEAVGEAVPELQEKLLAGSYQFRNAPFELFISVIQQGLLLRVFEVLEPLAGGKFNAFHFFLGRLLLAGKIRHLITTNFDYMFEMALGDLLKNIDTFYSWNDIGAIRKSSRPSVVATSSSAMIYWEKPYHFHT